MTPDALRTRLQQLTGWGPRPAAAVSRKDAAPEAGHPVETLVLQGPRGPMPATLIRPEIAGPLPAVLYCTGDRSDADARVALVSVTKKAPTDQCAPVQLYDRNMTRARRLARRMLAGDA